MRPVRFHIFLDRIEDGQWAVFRFQKGGEMVLPLKIFPAGLRAGQSFSLNFTRDKESEKSVQALVQRLQKKLLSRKPR